MTKKASAKPTKYADRLKQTAEEKEQANVPFKVDLSKNSIEKEKIDVRQAISEANLKIEDLKNTHPLNFDEIFKQENLKDLKTRRLDQIAKLEEDLF